MSFTDDDLKRLKELLHKAHSEGWTGCYMCSRFKEDSYALLARLEAAEKVIQAHNDLERENINYDKFVGLLNAWRRAKGESK